MQTSRPAHKRLYDISEVSCPDSCNQPAGEKGCHFRMGPDRFTCTKCQLRIWRNFMGYELTPTDLQEMLHGDKVTSTEKTLTRQKDGQEITIRGRLMLNEEYKVRIAPKLKSKTATDQTCPKCKTGKLQLITGIDDSKWYGCSGYPQCRFTKTYIPHTFTPAMLQAGSGGEKPGGKHAKQQKRPGERWRWRAKPNIDAEDPESAFSGKTAGRRAQARQGARNFPRATRGAGRSDRDRAGRKCQAASQTGQVSAHPGVHSGNAQSASIPRSPASRGPIHFLRALNGRRNDRTPDPHPLL